MIFDDDLTMFYNKLFSISKFFLWVYYYVEKKEIKKKLKKKRNNLQW